MMRSVITLSCLLALTSLVSNRAGGKTKDLGAAPESEPRMHLHDQSRKPILHRRRRHRLSDSNNGTRVRLEQFYGRLRLLCDYVR